MGAIARRLPCALMLMLALVGAPALAAPHAAVQGSPPKSAKKPSSGPSSTGHHGATPKAHGHKGPKQSPADNAKHSHGPPPTWAIRPTSGQRAAASDEEYTDADPPPWSSRWGCVTVASGRAGLPAAIGVTDDSLRGLIAGDGIEVPVGEATCIPYSLVTSEDTGLLAVAFVAADATDSVPRMHVYARERPHSPWVARTQRWPPEGDTRVVTLDPDDAMWNTGDAETQVPRRLSYTVVSLTRSLVQPLPAATTAAAAVRLVITTRPDEAEPRLASVELVDRASGRSLGQALWIDRDDLPGGYYAANGESFEPLFWVSPVNFTYVSRGIATGHAASMAARAKHAAKTKTKRKLKLAALTRHGALHIGVDYVAPTGTPVICVADGTVLFAGPFSGYGNLIIIQHNGGYTTHYGHLSRYASDLGVGSVVHRGEVLGEVGATGLATGPHLHFEIRRQGAYIDPLDLAQPYTLWSLRAADYGRLAQSLLIHAAAPTEVGAAARRN